MWPFTRRRADSPLTEKIEPPPFIARATPYVEQKASAVGALISARVLNLPQWPRRSFEQSAKEGYQQNPVVNACVWKTTRAAAAVPLAIMRGDEEVDIPELRALLRRPNPAQDGPAFVQATLADLMLAGEFFAERVDVGSKPRELYRWSPAKTAVNPGPDGFPKSYTFKIADKERVVEVDLTKGVAPILHVRDYNPIDDWRGLPSIDPAAFSVDAHTGALRWNVALLRNGAQPSGALVYAPKDGSDKLSDEQWARLKAELEESFSGSQNAGKPLLLDGGLDWKEMGFSPKDMNFSEGLNSAARLIALAFGVPPLILGIPGDNTFANYAEANKAWYRETILPLLSQWCRAMSWWIGPAFGKDIRIEPDTDDLEVFADERAAEWQRVESSTSMTINEKRERQGLPPVAGGEVILVSSALIPLEAVGETLQGGAAPEDDEVEEDDQPKSFNPNQPRDPAGTSTGGRWTSASLSRNVGRESTEAEIAAVQAYMANGYKDINEFLRNEFEEPSVEDLSYFKSVDALKRAIEDMDNYVARHVLSKDVTLFRAVEEDAVYEWYGYDDPIPGLKLLDRGFISTNKVMNDTIAEWAGRGNTWIMEIHAPKGTIAVDVEKLQTNAHLSGEKEVILARETVLRITAVDIEGKKLKAKIAADQFSKKGHATAPAPAPIKAKAPSRTKDSRGRFGWGRGDKLEILK